jgi:hypothetical protein
MTTHIVDFQKKKLVTMKGSLKEFVAKYPEKKVCFFFDGRLVGWSSWATGDCCVDGLVDPAR